MEKIAGFCCAAALLALFSSPLRAQTMNMAGMENSVGFLSSGTSVEPKSTSETDAMTHRPLGNWSLMFHATGFLVDTQQRGPRGGDKLYSTNWIMPMLTRQSGRHSITLRTMLSIEPATVTKRRYPELLQTGETAYGQPIVDGQHPHELFMEVAARYDFRINERSQVFVYGGPLGDPALGPPAYAHRSSTSENPVAILGHHQQDSTHISNSVITLGFIQGPLQLEASTFRGREPNENRWNIDGGTPDSFAARATAGIGSHISGQFSAGRINNREALEPKVDTLRMTASLHHNVRFSKGHVSSSLIWGRNKDFDSRLSRISNAYSVESTARFLNNNWAWTRIENLDRVEDITGRVQAYTFGYERELPSASSALNLGLGFQATAYGIPKHLKPEYGSHPAGFSVFLRLRPKGNMMQHMQQMHQH